MHLWIISGLVGLAWALARQRIPGRSAGKALGGSHSLASPLASLPCPPATQSVKINTHNRDLAVKSAFIRYGPLNMSDQSYWRMVAQKWGTTPAVARESRCANCAAFDLSPRMKGCMPGAIQKDGGGELGYCHMHLFKCSSLRSCLTWVGGGPITTDQVSADWQKE